MAPLPPLVSRHDSWVSVDPVIGCPADCSYCYLQPLNLTRRRPEIRSSLEEVMSAIAAHFESTGHSWGRPPSPVPICIGNYTDIFMSVDIIDFTAGLCREISKCFPDHLVILITKSPMACQAIERLGRPSLPMILFLSQSFACESTVAEVEKGKTASVAVTIGAARKAKEVGIIPIHFWRPFSPTLNSAHSLAGRVQLVREAGFSSSVVVGFKTCDSALNTLPRAQALLKQAQFVRFGEVTDPQLLQTLLEEGHRQNYPVYRHTSCAIANAMRIPEPLGTWRPGLCDSYCAPCSCPPVQREKCTTLRNLAESPEPQLLERLRVQTQAARVAWEPDHSLIRLGCELPQDQVCALSHAVGFRIEPDKVVATRAWRGSI
jgi:DNA repair photolyase